MKNFLLAERYAGGLIGSLEVTELDNIDMSLTDMAQMVAEHPEVSNILYNNAISSSVRSQILREILSKGGFASILINLADLLIRKGRIRILSDIARVFSIMADDVQHRARAVITTALPLSEEQKQSLNDSLEQYCGCSVHLYCEVNPEILGGVVAQIGSMRIDGSVQNRLQHLREELLSSN